MLCQAKAFLPVSMNHSGTAGRAFMASLKAARSRSSSHPLRTWLASPCIDLLVSVAEGGQGVRPAHAIQAPGPLRSYAADRDTGLGVDLRIGMRRIADQHGQQLLAPGRQLGE